MKALRVFLVRHAETVSNAERRFGGWGDAPLSPRGLSQAQAVGRALASKGPLGAIYASDLVRARDTALAIAEATGYPRDAIEVTADLREQHFGVLDGLKIEDVERHHPEIWSGLFGGAWGYTVPEGESNAAVIARVGRALETAVRSHHSGPVVIVSHMVAISHMLRLVMEIPEDAHPRVAFRIKNGSVHRLVRRDNRTWWVEGLNDTSHLAGLE